LTICHKALQGERDNDVPHVRLLLLKFSHNKHLLVETEENKKGCQRQPCYLSVVSHPIAIGSKIMALFSMEFLFVVFSVHPQLNDSVGQAWQKHSK